MKPDSLKPVHRCFETLSNPLRLDIIRALNKNEMCVTDLSTQLNAERSRVSHSLKLLKRCTIVHSKADGKKQIYYLDPKVTANLKKESILTALSHYMDGCYANCGCT